MSAIGSVLKEARAKKAVTLEDVHSKIKIHPRVLQLLEEEKFDKLPSPLFVKSFLKSYAEFLEVNGEELVGLYEKDKVREPDQTLYIPSADERARAARTRPRNLTVSVAVGAALFIAGWFILPPVFRAAGHGLSKVRDGLTAFYGNASKKKNQKTAASSKTNGRSPAAKEIPTKPARDESILHSAALGNFQPIPKNQSLQLEIRALDTVWLKILTDKKTAFQGLVKKGDMATATAKDQIELSTGNPDNMFWSLNGRPIGSPGKGVTRKMMVTRDGIRNLQLPRADQ